jgi:tetratricopeptide (TPR) repeat protein
MAARTARGPAGLVSIPSILAALVLVSSIPAGRVSISSISARAQIYKNNSIRGKVRSVNGNTVNNAIVELKLAGGGMIGQTATSGDGDFTFGGLAAGEYEIDVALSGYESTGQMVRFNHAPNENFQETLPVEIVIRPRVDQILAPPGTNFAQEVPRPARAAYEKGIQLLAEGKSDEAIASLRRATELCGEYFNAYYSLGAAYYRVERMDEAIQALEQARRINDHEGAVYHLFGLVMLRQRKFTVAEYVFKQATSFNPTNAASHFLRGLALVEIGVQERDGGERERDFTDAEKELDSAWNLSNKRIPQVYLQRSRIHEVRGQKEAAAKDLEAYLKADPESKQAPAIRQAISKLRGTDPK